MARQIEIQVMFLEDFEVDDDYMRRSFGVKRNLDAVKIEDSVGRQIVF